MPIADFQAKANTTLENISQSEAIHPRNKELIQDSARDQRLNDLAEATVAKNLSRLKVLAEKVEGPFDEMDTADVKDLVDWIQSQDYAPDTVYTYKNVLRSFWKWMKPTENGEAPFEVNWFALTPLETTDTLPQDLLTKEDIEAQIEAAYNPRDKAFIALLYETGARIGELIDLKVGDIEDREHGRKVIIEGKPELDAYRWLNLSPISMIGRTNTRTPRKMHRSGAKFNKGDPMTN